MTRNVLQSSISWIAMKNKFFIPKPFQPFVQVFDVLFSSIIAGPLVIVYWVSTWKLCDIFIMPDDPTTSAVISLAIGSFGQFFLMFYQGAISELLTFKKRKFVNLMVSKMYALVLAQTCIHYWRGVWAMIDLFSPTDTFVTVMNVVQNCLILMISKTLRNSISVPFVVTTDQVESDYGVSTYFKRVVNELNFDDRRFQVFIYILRKLTEVLLSSWTASAAWR